MPFPHIQFPKINSLYFSVLVFFGFFAIYLASNRLFSTLFSKINYCEPYYSTLLSCSIFSVSQLVFNRSKYPIIKCLGELPVISRFRHKLSPTGNGMSDTILQQGSDNFSLGLFLVNGTSFTPSDINSIGECFEAIISGKTVQYIIDIRETVLSITVLHTI